MNDTQDNGHLHLVRVGEDQAVRGTVPARVQTKGIDMAVGNANIGVSLEVPSRVEQVKGSRNNIVVDETSIDRKETHEQNDVSSTACLLELAARSFVMKGRTRKIDP